MKAIYRLFIMTILGGALGGSCGAMDARSVDEPFDIMDEIDNEYERMHGRYVDLEGQTERLRQEVVELKLLIKQNGKKETEDIQDVNNLIPEELRSRKTDRPLEVLKESVMNLLKSRTELEEEVEKYKGDHESLLEKYDKLESDYKKLEDIHSKLVERLRASHKKLLCSDRK